MSRSSSPEPPSGQSPSLRERLSDLIRKRNESREADDTLANEFQDVSVIPNRGHCSSTPSRGKETGGEGDQVTINQTNMDDTVYLSERYAELLEGVVAQSKIPKARAPPGGFETYDWARQKELLAYLQEGTRVISDI